MPTIGDPEHVGVLRLGWPFVSWAGQCEYRGFGRTMRAPDMPIAATGTNHNQFANSILLGGKGIRSGLVVGASDLADEKAVLSRIRPRRWTRCSRRSWAGRSI